jgi:hypothetical protein
MHFLHGEGSLFILYQHYTPVLHLSLLTNNTGHFIIPRLFHGLEYGLHFEIS